MIRTVVKAACSTGGWGIVWHVLGGEGDADHELLICGNRGFFPVNRQSALDDGGAVVEHLSGFHVAYLHAFDGKHNLHTYIVNRMSDPIAGMNCMP
jgi:hypothetical protein